MQLDAVRDSPTIRLLSTLTAVLESPYSGPGTTRRATAELIGLVLIRQLIERLGEISNVDRSLRLLRQLLVVPESELYPSLGLRAADGRQHRAGVRAAVP